MAILSKIARFWLVLVLIAVSGYVAIYNQDKISVTIPPVFAATSMPAYIALIGAFLRGGIAASLYFGADLVKKSMANKKLTRSVNRLRTEVQKLTPGDPRDGEAGPMIRADGDHSAGGRA